MKVKTYLKSLSKLLGNAMVMSGVGMMAAAVGYKAFTMVENKFLKKPGKKVESTEKI